MSVIRTVATYNLALHCQDLKIAGSEKPTVVRMVKAHAPKWGAYSAEYMALYNVDVFGTQEMLSSTKFLENLNEYGLDYKCHLSKGKVVAIFYRSSTMGRVEPLDGIYGNHDVRDVAAIYVPRFELVFLSAWLGHKHEHKKVEALESIDESLQVALGKRKVSRVILVGDMNDYSGGLAKKTVKLAGLKTQLSGKLVRTCSEGSHFKGVGDMIFDSAQGTEKIHGIPPLPHGWNPYTQLCSDHLPVYAVKEFKEFHNAHAAPNKRKLDAKDRRETKLRLRSPSPGPRDVALWDDVDPHESAYDVRQELGLLCCKRARQE